MEILHKLTMIKCLKKQFVMGGESVKTLLNNQNLDLKKNIGICFMFILQCIRLSLENITKLKVNLRK